MIRSDATAERPTGRSTAWRGTSRRVKVSPAASPTAEKVYRPFLVYCDGLLVRMETSCPSSFPIALGLRVTEVTFTLISLGFEVPPLRTTVPEKTKVGDSFDRAVAEFS